MTSLPLTIEKNDRPIHGNEVIIYDNSVRYYHYIATRTRFTFRRTARDWKQMLAESPLILPTMAGYLISDNYFSSTILETKNPATFIWRWI